MKFKELNIIQKIKFLFTDYIYCVASGNKLYDKDVFNEEGKLDFEHLIYYPLNRRSEIPPIIKKNWDTDQEDEAWKDL